LIVVPLTGHPARGKRRESDKHRIAAKTLAFTIGANVTTGRVPQVARQNRPTTHTNWGRTIWATQDTVSLLGTTLRRSARGGLK
jgi:hypothetical protein